MKKIICKEKRKTRHDLANPIKMSFKNRLIKSNAINLKNNYYIKDLRNGYCKFNPINPNKKFK